MGPRYSCDVMHYFVLASRFSSFFTLKCSFKISQCIVKSGGSSSAVRMLIPGEHKTLLLYWYHNKGVGWIGHRANYWGKSIWNAGQNVLVSQKAMRYVATYFDSETKSDTQQKLKCDSQNEKLWNSTWPADFTVVLTIRRELEFLGIDISCKQRVWSNKKKHMKADEL